MPDEMDELIDEIDLGSTRGRPKSAPTMTIVRALTEADIPALQQGNSAALAPQSLPSAGGYAGLQAIKHSHHQLAQLLASGTSDREAALLVGYSPGRVSQLRNDPAFLELLAQYGLHAETQFVEMIDRMKAVGLRALEEIEGRLEDEPEKWTRKDLMDATELLLVKPIAAMRQSGGGSSGAASPIAIDINFVNSPAAQHSNSHGAGPIIDLVVEEPE